MSLSKSKMREPSKIVNNKTAKKQETGKASNSPASQPSSSKKIRKSENPVRVLLAPESDLRSSKSLICKNSSCKDILTSDDEFCKRCSCCICHSFDDNKDPSLWLVCSSEHEDNNLCGLSCHVECALQHEKVGVVALSQSITLDGSYCCASCGKVSDILGWLKKHLVIARDARRVAVLSYRIYLTYRILKGTSKYRELIGIITELKDKIENEVGPIYEVSSKMSRLTVGRLTTASDIQSLCSLAIDKAEESLSTFTEDPHPAACMIIFEEVDSYSVQISLVESSSSCLSQDIKGYKLWYRMVGEETCTKEPAFILARDQRRISVSSLRPGTEYVFRVTPFTETAELGHSEAKCSTRSAKISNKIASLKSADNTSGALGLKVPDHGKTILRAACGQGQGGQPEGFCRIDTECCRKDHVPYLPDLNEEAVPPFENFMEAEDTPGMDNKLRSNSEEERCTEKEKAKEEAHDSDSARMNGSNSPNHPCNSLGSFEQNFEHGVKVVRSLEQEGHIDEEFRMKFLTWFCFRSTQRERRVVYTFVKTMSDDPRSLAGQLVDSFTEIISSKRQRIDKKA